MTGFHADPAALDALAVHLEDTADEFAAASADLEATASGDLGPPAVAAALTALTGEWSGRIRAVGTDYAATADSVHAAAKAFRGADASAAEALGRITAQPGSDDPGQIAAHPLRPTDADQATATASGQTTTQPPWPAEPDQTLSTDPGQTTAQPHQPADAGRPSATTSAKPPPGAPTPAAPTGSARPFSAIPAVPMAEFRGLGFDPVPGSADAVAEAARRCVAAAAKLGDAPTPGEIPEWAGRSAQALADRAGRTRAGLAAVPEALREAAAVLDDWAGVLAAHRRQAEDLDHRAGTARRVVVDAQDDVERAETTVQFSPGAEGELTAARSRLTAAQRDLDRLLDQARDLERVHSTEAARVAERLRSLGDGAPLPSAPDFRGLATQLDTFSQAGRDLGVTVARTPVAPVTPPAGAVGAFTAALGGR